MKDHGFPVRADIHEVGITFTTPEGGFIGYPLRDAAKGQLLEWVNGVAEESGLRPGDIKRMLVQQLLSDLYATTV